MCVTSHRNPEMNNNDEVLNSVLLHYLVQSSIIHWPADVLCVERTVILVGGDHFYNGRLEYCYDGTWYSVCADDWEATGEEARMVCYSVNSSTLQLGKHYT